MLVFGQVAALTHAKAWIDAFNSHDLEAVMAFYADDVQIKSPLVARALQIPDGVLKGKEAVRKFFALGTQTPKLHFQLKAVLVGANSITVLYTNHTGQLVTDCSELNAEKKIERMVACYTENTP
jgi:ketosteroid isomerase-like protein